MKSIAFILILFCISRSNAESIHECGLLFKRNRFAQLMVTDVKLDSGEISTGLAFGLPELDWVIGIGLDHQGEDLLFSTPRLEARALRSSDSRTKILEQLEHPSFLIFWSGAKDFMSNGLWLPSFMLRGLELQKFATNHERDKVNYFLPIARKMSGEVIGYVDWTRKDSNFEITVGYGIFESFRNRGYATEAIRGLVKKLQREYPEYKIRAGVSVRNPGSLKVLKSAGFYQVGNHKVGKEIEKVFAPGSLQGIEID